MISFRHCVMHITNLHNSICIFRKINNKSFYISSYSSFKNSLIDNHFKTLLVHSTGINNTISKECSNQINHIINRTKQNSIYQKQCKFISTHTSVHKIINKRSSYFGTNPLFIKNDFTTRNRCNVRQISSFFEGMTDSLYTNYVNLIYIISGSTPVEFTQDSLVWLHTYTGLPWWATIILATSLLRLIISLPLSIYQQNITAKLENLQHEMVGITTNLKRKTKEDMFRHEWSEEYTRRMYNRSVRKAWKDLIVRDNCHPVKSILLLYIEVPILIISTFALRNLCYMFPKSNIYAYENYLELTTGGFGWILNLADIDHFFILPVLIGLINLANIEVAIMFRLKEPTRLQKGFFTFFRLVALIIIPLAPYIPSSLSLYWITNSAFSLCQKFLLMSPKFRRLTRIPETDSELSHPYSYLYEKMKNRAQLMRRLK
ncbi:cytochrome c oxidase assembly protein COX18, mitochondrial-like [Vespa mandarinia]|uniref:cytochrome c oxidase assembly protein COX18, mitochondrial-like n=1 Tax=Vespa mandarinia TaxID=7446 RepID=UPI0016134A62|nr:cytochrome c oxidase assembly protein COX18, mitochondrial-like [Vespa mandarinia]